MQTLRDRLKRTPFVRHLLHPRAESKALKTLAISTVHNTLQ
jgi:hypothetical protein